MYSYGSSFGDFSSMEALPALAGDFYNEPDDVTRGLSMYSSADDFSHFDGAFQKGALDFCDGQMLFGKSMGLNSETTHQCRGNVVASSRFQEGDSAWPVPEDSLFQLAQTSIEVSQFSAATIGNCLLDFLSGDAAGAISKVNPLKFTIKAQVCIDGLTCETKVRVYRQAFGLHVVEMQRRSGDSLAFQSLFQWASEHLRNLATSAITAEAPTFAGVPRECCMELDFQASVAPLLDLAENCGNMQIQAEAVQGLLQAATDRHLAIQLLTPEALLAFQNLLQLVCFSVADPLFRLLSCLAIEAERDLMDKQLLQGMTNKAEQMLIQCKPLQTQQASY